MEPLVDSKIRLAILILATSALAGCYSDGSTRYDGIGGAAAGTGDAGGATAGTTGGGGTTGGAAGGAGGGAAGSNANVGGFREGGGRSGTSGGNTQECTTLPILGATTPAGAGGGGQSGAGGSPLGAAGSGGQMGRISFSAPATYKLAAQPYSVAIGDLNGDGQDDFAVAAVPTATAHGGVAVFLNQGDGTFSDPVLIEIQAWSIAIADLNGDGKKDMAVNTAWAVRTLINNGDGTFATNASYVIPAESYSLTAGDMNGDGKVDLAVAYNDGLSVAGVAVFRNNGNGTFAGATTYPAGDAPNGLALGDLNGDGKPDLVVANDTSEIAGVQETLHVLLNRGDGTFGAATPYPAGEWLSSATIADLNADGWNDVVVTEDYGAGVLLNRGDGTLGARVTYSVSGGRISLAAGDMDGDGRADLVVSNPLAFGTAGWFGGNVAVLLNHGDGTFAEPVYFFEEAVQGAIAIGRLNGDAKTDVIVGNREFNCVESVSVLLNTSR